MILCIIYFYIYLMPYSYIPENLVLLYKPYHDTFYIREPSC